MSELNCYSTKNNLNTAANQAETAPASNNKTVEDFGQLPVVVHYHRLDSKIILQNMEEVLDTVKKQHKEKHRRKKELKKLAMFEAANGTHAHSVTEEEPKEKKKEHSEKKHKHRDREKRHSKKNPLQEKSSVENGKALQESPVKSGTILQHFPRTPKKGEPQLSIQDDEVEVVVKDEHKRENSEKVTTTPPKNSKVTNAFEVMMNARNKSIGSNTPGKDLPSPVTDGESGATNVKRKLKLQEWAEQKGGAKRKLEEEARAAYVDDQLEQRAKKTCLIIVLLRPLLRIWSLNLSRQAIPNEPTPTRVRQDRSTENIEDVEADPYLSIPRPSQQLGLSKTTTWRILRKDLVLKLCKVQLVQELNHSHRRRFAQFIQEQRKQSSC